MKNSHSIYVKSYISRLYFVSQSSFLSILVWRIPLNYKASSPRDLLVTRRYHFLIDQSAFESGHLQASSILKRKLNFLYRGGHLYRHGSRSQRPRMSG